MRNETYNMVFFLSSIDSSPKTIENLIQEFVQYFNKKVFVEYAQ